MTDADATRAWVTCWLIYRDMPELARWIASTLPVHIYAHRAYAAVIV